MNAHQRRVEKRRLERIPLLRGEMGTLLGFTIITSEEQMVETYGHRRGVLPGEASAWFDAYNPPVSLEVMRSKDK